MEVLAKICRSMGLLQELCARSKCEKTGGAGGCARGRTNLGRLVATVLGGNFPVLLMLDDIEIPHLFPFGMRNETVGRVPVGQFHGLRDLRIQMRTPSFAL